MKVFVYLLFLLGGIVYANSYRTAKESLIIEAMVSSYYTGCMGGVIATIEEGFFKEGKNAVEANKNFYKLKLNCIKQQAEYAKILKD